MRALSDMENQPPDTDDAQRQWQPTAETAQLLGGIPLGADPSRQHALYMGRCVSALVPSGRERPRLCSGLQCGGLGPGGSGRLVVSGGFMDLSHEVERPRLMDDRAELSAVTESLSSMLVR
jgi:hypothetical protein